RDRVGRGRVARRPPPPARRGARRRHRGTRPARGTVHAARGPDVHRLTLGLAALRATGVGALLLLIRNPPAVRPGLGRAPRPVLPRTPIFDACVSDVTGPSRIAAGDTIRLRVSYGTAGKRETGNGKGTAVLGASVAGRRIVSRVVNLPDSGIVSTDLTFPVSRFPFPGWVAVDVRLEGVSDSEPRDDARTVVLQVSAPPSIVLLASPPDWDTRFLAHALEDVAQAAVKVFVAADPGGTRWRDAATLAAVRPGEVARAVQGAQLLVEAGDPATFARVAA